MENETITVIVPVYNTRQYLPRCLESICLQTYPDLEILLIDDGSTDGSGLVCEEMGKKDDRIRTLHKENGGLSDARNYGIDHAKGDYLLFIDSDDYLAPEMVQRLYLALKQKDAQMSICNCLEVDEAGNPVPEDPFFPIQDETLTGMEAVEKLFERKGWCYTVAWNKLYKKELFSAIRFPKGKLHEDAFTTHRLFAICERISCVRYTGYYYVQHDGSIMHTRSAKSYLHAAEAYLERADFLNAHELYKAAGYAYFISGIYLSKVYLAGEPTEELRQEIRETIKEFRKRVRLGSSRNMKERIQIRLISISPRLYRKIIRVRDGLNLPSLSPE